MFKKLARVQAVDSLLYSVDYTRGYFFTGVTTTCVLGHVHMRKQNTRSTGLAYKEEIERSTSGRGARASYLTMFPEISAR